jgi:hypothetical protein
MPDDVGLLTGLEQFHKYFAYCPSGLSLGNAGKVDFLPRYGRFKRRFIVFENTKSPRIDAEQAAGQQLRCDYFDQICDAGEARSAICFTTSTGSPSISPLT